MLQDWNIQQRCGNNIKPCYPKDNYQIQNSLQITNNVVHLCLIWKATGPSCSEGEEEVSIYMRVYVCGDQQPLRYGETANRI
jgi:hypothetical protein